MWRCGKLQIRLVVYGCGESLLINLLAFFCSLPKVLCLLSLPEAAFVESLIRVLHLHGFYVLLPELRLTVTSWTLFRFSEMGIWRWSLRGRFVSDSCISDDGSL